MGLELKLPQSSSTARVKQQGAQKWRALDDNRKQITKSDDSRPNLGTNNAIDDGSESAARLKNEEGGGGTQFVEIDKIKESELSNGVEVEDFLPTGDLPKTPGWVPKLTPTRRGDELFLRVA